MKRIARNPGKFEPLNLYTAVGREMGYQLDSEVHQTQFVGEVAKQLKASQADLRMLHGKRVEAMFAHVAGALGQCLMVKTEDAGEIFAANQNMKIPDYRLVLKDRSQMLVEVKNYHGDALKRPYTLGRKYVDQLKRYAELNATPLKFAVFFSAWRCWCLLSPDSFEKKGNDLVITFPNAVARNEMASIGEVSIATLPKLRIEFRADPAEADTINERGQARFTIRSAKIFCSDKEIVDPAEQSIAFRLMRSGNWPDTSEADIQDGKLLGVIITSRPETPPEDQPFAIVGSLSSLVTSAYAELTVEGQRLTAIDVAADPTAFALHIPEDYKSDALPLWRFVMQPNPDFRG
jgi:hypothetical protein